MSSLQIWLIFFHYHNGKVTATLFIWKILTDWCMLSHFSHIWFFVTLKNMAHQAPLSMGFSRQEYWSELPCSPPGHLPNPGIEPTSVISPALAGGFFTTSTTWIDLLNHCKLWVSICQSSNESFTRRTEAEAETPILWPPDGKNQLFGKDPDAGKDWRREEKGTTEDEMVGWYH